MNTAAMDNDTRRSVVLRKYYLSHLNSEEVVRLLPLNIYLALISVIGIIGNSVVCHVYRTRYKRSNSKYFITCLSVIDLFSCGLVMPFEIFTVLHQYTFENSVICKLTRFINTWPTVASGFMFLAIAVDRYRKVCRPFGWQISPRLAKWVCVGCILVGAALSWPALVLYGRKTFYVLEHSINATECSVDDSMRGKIYPFINNATFGFLFMVGTTSLVVFYSIIGCTISRHTKNLIQHQTSVEMKSFKLDQSDYDSNVSNSKQIADEIETSEEMHADTIPRRKVSKAPTSAGTLSPAAKSSDALVDTNTNGRIRKTSSNEPRKCTSAQNLNRCVSYETNYRKKSNDKGMLNKLSLIKCRLTSSGSSFDTETGNNIGGATIGRASQSRQKRVRKTSLLMFLISLAYTLSYLPHVLLMLLRAVDEDFVSSMSNEGRATYKFFLRSYALNCVVNPFIYSACDVRFRDACRHLFSGISHQFKKCPPIRRYK